MPAPITFAVRPTPGFPLANLSPKQTSPWNPKSVTTTPLVCWYAPDDITTLFTDTAGTTPVTADGDLVACMKDKSGNNNHATQATSGARPIYRSGGYLDFDGARYLTTGSIQLTGTGQHSAAAAAYFTTVASYQNVLDADNGTSVRISQLLRCNPSGQLETIAFNTAPSAFTDTGPSISATTGVVLSEITSATTTEAFVNGVGSGGSTATSGTPASVTSVLTIGSFASGNSQFLNGRFYGSANYQGALSSGDHALLVSYLTAKFITISGSLAKTLNAVTLSSNANLKITGSLAKTLNAVTLSSNANLKITGSLAKTLNAVTLSSNANLKITGSLDKTLGAVTLSSNANLKITGSLAKTLGAVTLSSNANLLIKGSLNKTFGVVTLNSQGTLKLSGSLNKTLGVLAGSETGILLIKGSSSLSLGPVILASSGHLSIHGSVNTTLGSLTGTLIGQHSQSGILNITLSGVRLSSTIKMTPRLTVKFASGLRTSIQEQVLHSRQRRVRTTSYKVRQ